MKNNNNLNVYQIIVKNMMAALTDMIRILAITEIKTLEETIKDMTEILPTMKNIPATTNLEVLQKTIQHMANTIPDLTKISVSTESALAEPIKNMVDTTTSTLAVLSIIDGGTLQKTIDEMACMIPQMTKILPKINWANFEPTDEEIKIAQKTLHSKELKEILTEKFREKQVEEKLNNASKMVVLILMLLYCTIMLINDLSIITLKEITHQKIGPIVNSVQNANRKKIKPKKQLVIELKEMLKQEIPTELIQFFKVSIQENLVLYLGPNANSKIVGNINSTGVVQCMEQRRDWTCILYNNPMNGIFLEGWVLTKYLQNIS